MKATKLLVGQHREVETLLERLEEGAGQTPELVRELADNLVAHMVIEQEIFYRAVREVDESLVLESYEEHAVARFALRRLLHVDRENESFQARLATLSELILSHVKEEETELFPEVEEAIADEKLEEMGAKMERLFTQVKAGGYEAVLSQTRQDRKGQTRDGNQPSAARS